jgi:hypothetical protein
MPNITRGGDMGGVVRYLISHGKEAPGKPGAHTEPHLVAGSPAVMAFWGADELHPSQAGAIARELDHPRLVFGTTVTMPKKDAEGHVVGRRDAHVWHCSLSLRPDEAALSDERWAHIAEDFVAGMGFDDAQAAACRWAAVHHGLSKAGNDHIHIVVGLVREDGSKARVNRDQPRAQRLAGELERKYGLEVLESRESGHTSRGYTPLDQARDEAGRDWAPAMNGERTDRGRLERTVRACATAASEEADFVRLLRFHGLRVKPRFAAGRGDRIGGYAVAFPPPKGKSPVWFSGGRLARDLTLPGIRASAGWADTPAQASAAVAEWTAAGRQQPDVGTTRLPTRDPGQWQRASQELGALRDRLRAVGPGDRAEWARIAGDAAGVLAAWSLEAEPEPGPLAAAAAALGRSAQLPAWQARTTRRVRAPSAQGAALLFAAAAQPSNGALGWMVLLRQMANLAKALHDAHAARGDLQRAQQIERAVRGELEAVNARLEGDASGARPALNPEELRAAETARRGQLPLRPGASPLPGAPAEPPARPPVTRPPDRERDPNRGAER